MHSRGRASRLLFCDRVGVHLDLHDKGDERVSGGAIEEQSTTCLSERIRREQEGERRRTRSILIGCKGRILSLTGTFSCARERAASVLGLCQDKQDGELQDAPSRRASCPSRR